MGNPEPDPDDRREPTPLERLASFRFAYLAIFACLAAYVFSVEGFERAMAAHFRTAVAEAVAVDPADGSVPEQIQGRMDALLHGSPWIRLGVRVRPVVLGADGTLLYAGGGVLPATQAEGRDGQKLLPALADVAVSVPHNTLAANGILVAYAAALVTLLYGYTRRWTRRELERLAEIQRGRDASLERAAHIEEELDVVRSRLARLEPEKETEIRALEGERSELLARLSALEAREEALRASSSKARELEDEHRALEELLDEAVRDVERRDDEIRALQKQVKRAGRDRGRDADLLGRRLRTLYKNLEVDDRALDDLAALGDESLRLKAEEALKRLSDETDSAAVRRKVGGLPPQLSIFELGFAGKGRIYYTRGRSRRFRVLLVGAKNSQKTDLEYLSRLPRG